VNATPVIDAHQHFWDPAPGKYPWMTEELASIRRPFTPHDLRPLLEEAGVDATVLVQTRSSLEETREFLSLAANTEFIAGVVGWVDLTDPMVATTLAELRDSPGGEFLVGVRHQVHDEPDPAWLLRDDVQFGLRAVEQAGLAFDLLVRTRELSAARRVVRDHPTLRFVIDHLAKPPIRSGEMADWVAAMAPFSDCANVSCKLSGMVTEANWTDWTVADLRPYAERVMGWFGSERLMFGSDWPVCLLAAPYSRVADTDRALVSILPIQDQQAIFGGNAVRFYRLNEVLGIRH
jgi:L-fuconolactonase